MTDINIRDVLSVPIEKTEREKQVKHDPLSDFKSALNKSVNELNDLMAEANQSVQEMTLGEKDIHETMIDLEKAGISLRMMIQIRNKVLAAYEEIMRMQV